MVQSNLIKNRLFLTLLLVSAALLIAGLIYAVAQKRDSSTAVRPRRVTTAQGTVIKVSANGDLQHALNIAECGDTIVLDAGATFLASGELGFVFPLKSGGSCTGKVSDTITITSSSIANMAPDKRVEIADAVNMPKILTAGPYPAMSFAPNSRFWHLEGIEITTKPSGQYTQFLVLIGTNVPATATPSDISFDRCYIHSREDGTDNPHATARAGVDVEAARVKFTNSRVAFPAGYAGATKSSETNYAILMITGPGPLTIENCFLSAWYSNFFMGGGTLWTGNTATVASGATINRATLSNVQNLNVGDSIAFQVKPNYYEIARVTGLSGSTVSYEPWGGNIGPGRPLTGPPISPGAARWKGINPGNVLITRSTFYINPKIVEQIASEIGQYPKNFFEIKSADGLTLDGNEFTGYPSNFALTVRNQTGPSGAPSPWSTIRNVRITNNVYRDVSQPYAFQLFGIQLEDNIGTSDKGGQLYIANNLFATGGWIADLVGGDSVTIEHNTFLNNGTGKWADGKMMNGIFPTTNLVVKNNIAFNNEYGMHCQPPHDSTWTACWPGLNMAGNIIVQLQTDRYRPDCSNTYPPGNLCVSAMNTIGFVNPSGGDYRLNPDSKIKRRADDRTDPGVDMNKLEQALGKSISAQK